MVFDLLTQGDKEKIESYIDHYAYGDQKERSSLDYLLREWNKEKSKYLEKLFGKNLIITKPIEFKEGSGELYERMEELLWRDVRIRDFIMAIERIYAQRSDNGIYCYTSKEAKEERFVCNLFCSECLSDNKVLDRWFRETNTFELTLSNNDTLVIQKGMKPMRIISKIANSFKIGIEPDENGVSDLEYFRRKHSLGLNQKSLSGELCLSIHPLDYMTMSDNSNGWTSCMSWMGDGEYKQGTVEMMNSPCVVVAYLSSDKALDWHWDDDIGGNKYKWNSKKWRSLFIVDKDFIINIKSYPYHNENLVQATIKELAKMSGWGDVTVHDFMYFKEYEKYRRLHNPWEVEGKQVALEFTTGAMYNDFNTNHCIALNPNSTEDIIDFDYCYSGVSECMWCGTTDWSVIGTDIGESYLICTDCGPHRYCEWCDNNTYDDTYTTEDGYTICSYCYDQYTEEDVTNSCIYMRDNMWRISLSTKRNEAALDLAEYRYVCPSNIGSYSWNKMFKGRPREKYTDYSTLYYFLVEDCTKEGLEAFGIYSDEDLKDYLGEDDEEISSPEQETSSSEENVN